MEEKDKNTQLEVIKYLERGDGFVLYLFNKTNKISYAIYIVTDLIKDTEPLKWTLRKLATDAVSLKNFIEEKSCLISLERNLLEIESSIELAKFASLISPMNADVILHQVRLVISELQERIGTSVYSRGITSEFFNVPNYIPDTILENTSVRGVENDKSHKGHTVLYDFYHSSKSADRLGTKQKGYPENSNGSSETKGHREDSILKIIRERKLVTIKDITDRVTDCSEKTIQRILTSLVLEGKIKKTGERRWSKYSL